MVGMIILERCRVDPDNESGNRNAFKLGTPAKLKISYFVVCG